MKGMVNMKNVTIAQDLNKFFKKGDKVEVLGIDKKSQLVYVKKGNKCSWIMFKDIAESL